MRILFGGNNFAKFIDLIFGNNNKKLFNAPKQSVSLLLVSLNKSK
jgi:hypothetical protein